LKHGVELEVAALVFDDPNHRSEQDRFVNGEERWQTIGLANEDVIRIICARKSKP